MKIHNEKNKVISRKLEEVNDEKKEMADYTAKIFQAVFYLASFCKLIFELSKDYYK